MRNRVYPIIACAACIAAGWISLTAKPADARGPDFTTPDNVAAIAVAQASAPPLEFAVHETDKLRLAVTNWGYFGDRNGRLRLPDSTIAPRFEVPPHSDIQYLYDASVWLGGIVDGDTLVSTGMLTFGVPHELFPDNDAEPAFSDLYGDAEYTSTFVDTFTDPSFVAADEVDGPHRPLGIRVRQTTRTFDDPAYSGLLMSEFTVTNIGAQTIEGFHFGFHVDADIEHPDNIFSWLGDLTGYHSESVVVDGVPRTVAGQWALDADGDPDTILAQFDSASVTGVMGYTWLGGSIPTPTISANWWLRWFGQPGDWGPQRLPGRRNVHEGYGVPDGDAHKYFYLSNGEIDYPQYQTAIDKTADGWIAPPDSEWAYNYADGHDTRLLYSVGAVDLAPGSDVTFHFAWTVADSVHNDPSHFESTFDADDPSAYAAGLDFTDWVIRLGRAANLIAGDYYPAAVGPPRNVAIAEWDNHSATVSWRAKGTLRLAGFEILRTTDSLAPPTEIAGHVDAATTEFVDVGLDQGAVYYYAVRSIDSLGAAGLLSPRIAVNTDRPPAPFGLTSLRGNGKITLNWDDTVDPDVVAHRIYRTGAAEPDSLIAQTSLMTTFTDYSAINGVLHTYRIAAVSALGTESFLSEEIVALALAFDGGPLLLDANLADPSGIVDPDSVRGVWDRLLPDEVTVRVDDPNTPPTFDLVQFNHHPVTVVLSSGRFAPRPELYDDLTHYVNAGGAVVLVGRDLFNFDGLTEASLTFGPGDPAYDLFGLTAAEYPRVLLSNPTRFNAEFRGAVPTPTYCGWPGLTVDSSRTDWGANPALPHPGAAIPFVGPVTIDTIRAQVLYTYESTDPVTSSYHGMPVAVITTDPNRRCALLSFPLSYIAEPQAADVLDRLVRALGWAPDLPGDVSGDGVVDVLDAVALIDGLFRGGHLASSRNADVNADCVVDLVDVVNLVNYIFRGGHHPVVGCAG